MKLATLGMTLLAITLSLPMLAYADEGATAAPIDGPKAVFQDDLLDGMVGKWTTHGTVMGEPIQHKASVEWVLNHQFLRIHETSEAPMDEGEPPYEAMIFVGYDHMSERYVAHWIDVFGGRASETLGFGKRDGDSIRFVFEYPSGPFHTTFTWDPSSETWTWDMRTKTGAGEWVEFGRQILEKTPSQ